MNTDSVLNKIKALRTSLNCLSGRDEDFKATFQLINDVEQFVCEARLKMMCDQNKMEILKSKLACEELLTQMWKTEVENLAERHNNLKMAFNARHTEDQNR